MSTSLILQFLLSELHLFLQLLKFPKIKDRHPQTPAGICTCTSILLLHLPVVAANYEDSEGYQLLWKKLNIKPVTAVRWRARANSLQLTAFNQPSAIAVIASVGHAPETSEPNDGDPKVCRDPAPSAAIVEFVLYDTQQLELEECAV
ncbi:hypothetical protein V8E54_014411 [Elaphomyces granulatus]